MKFENLEYIRIENQTTSFPKHFHDTFCISLIHTGIEQIDFEDRSLFTEAGRISITNPYEIHSNPLIDSDAVLKFETIYVPDAVMKHALNGTSITFLNRQISDAGVNKLFEQVISAMDLKDDQRTESAFVRFAEALKIYAEDCETDHSGLDFKSFGEINTYIEDNIEDKFSLEDLAKRANINKYGFAKKFKVFTGMTPMNYILMKKMFSSKRLIGPSSDLTEVAYQYHFTDLAHFSKTFKRFIGISPKAYKQSIQG